MEISPPFFFFFFFFYLSISDDRSVRGLDLRLGGCRQKCRLVYRASVRWRRPVGEFPWHATRHLWHNPRQRDTIGRSASTASKLPLRLLLHLLLRPTIKTFLHLFLTVAVRPHLSVFSLFLSFFSPIPTTRLVRTLILGYQRGHFLLTTLQISSYCSSLRVQLLDVREAACT